MNEPATVVLEKLIFLFKQILFVEVVKFAIGLVETRIGSIVIADELQGLVATILT
jgi:hypothetical protein